MTVLYRPLATACLLSMISVGTAAQRVPPPRDVPPTGQQQPAPVGTAEISGTVMMSGGTQPARKTRITLSGVELRGGRSATTDDSGRFSFTALPAGRYTLSANRPGHISVTYGQRQPGRPGTAISLSDGQKFRADLQIPKGSVITGTVLDENGEPAPQTSVRVMRVVTSNGERTLSSNNGGSTDDRGIYRVFGLMPGEYVVCATPRNVNTTELRMEAMELEMRAQQQAAAQANAGQAQAIRDRLVTIQGSMPAADVEAAPGYAPICYPGTIAAASATPIPLGVSEERAGVDFQLQLAPLARIEGVVVNSTGAQITQINVSLRDASTLGGSTLNMEARPDEEGRFRLQGVPPGQYRLTARATIAPPRPAPGQQETFVGRGRGGAPAAAAGGARPQPLTVWAAADVAVEGRTVSNVLLSLQQGVSVSGQVTFEGSQPPPTDLTRIRVNMSPVGQTPFGGSTAAQVDAAGRFSLQGVPPGRYRLSASGSGGWTTESAIIGGQDSLDFPFEVKGNQSVQGVTITMTDRRTELTGKVLDGQNRPAVDYTIIVFPADQRYWAGASRRIQSTRPSTDGTFTFRNLPPGDYRIATPVDLEPGSTSDPAVLQQLEGASMRVTLQAGESKVQNIRVGQGG